MKKNYLLILFSMCSMLLASQVNVKYQITANYSGQALDLDSIVLENITNNSRVLVDSLPLTSSTYVLNISSSITDLANNHLAQSKFNLIKSEQGEYAVQYLGSTPTEAIVSIYNLSGQLCITQKLGLSPREAAKVSIGSEGIYFILVQTAKGSSTSYKVFGTAGNGIVKIDANPIAVYGNSKQPIQRTAQNVLNENEIQVSFAYNLGDSVRVSVYKTDYQADPVKLLIINDEVLDYELTFDPIMPETVIHDNVYEWVPATDNPEDEIIEFTENRLVVKLAGANGAGQGVIQRPQFVNFNTKDYANLQVGDILSIAPNKVIPDGALVKIKDVSYGPGTVLYDIETPGLDEVVVETGITVRKNLMDWFSNFEFEIKPCKGIEVTLGNEDGMAFLGIEVSTDVLKNKMIPSNNDKPEFGPYTKLKFKVGLDNNFVFALRKKKGETVDYLKIGFEGETEVKSDYELGFKYKNTKELFDPITLNKESHEFENIELARIVLAAIPLGTTPLYITIALALSLEIEITGEVKLVGTLIDVSWEYNYGLEYLRGRKDKDGKKDEYKLVSDVSKDKFKSKGFDLTIEGKVKLGIPLKLGAEFRFMNIKGAKAEVGLGYKFLGEYEAVFASLTDPNKKFEHSFELTARPFLYGEIDLSAGKVSVYNPKFELEFDDLLWKIYSSKDLPAGEWSKTIKESIRLLKGKNETIEFAAPYDHNFNIKQFRANANIQVQELSHPEYVSKKIVRIVITGVEVGRDVLEIKSDKKEAPFHITIDVIKPNAKGNLDDIPGELL